MRSASSAPPGQKFFLRSGRPRGMIKTLSTGACPPPNGFRAIPHNSKCRYGERGAAAAKPKAQITLDAAKVSAASGGNSEPKQGQRSQSARGFCPRSTMQVPQPDIIEHFGNADAVPQPPERCLSRQAGIVRCCPWNPQRIPAALCLKSCLCLRNIRHFLYFQIHLSEIMSNGSKKPRMY